MSTAQVAQPAPATEEQAAWFKGWFTAILENVESVVRGKTNQVALVLSCFFAEGHLLLEDKPGTGKTTLAKALAASIQGDWSRVQFTPDLMPSDVTGGMVYNQKSGEFEPHFGPVFSNVVLADEINRASPKTQASLLEVMEERQVTFGSQTNAVPRPFVVIATQNDLDQLGTYRLPEAQLDRFLMKTSLGYANTESTVEILRNNARGVAAEDLQPVVSTADVQRMISVVESVHVDDKLLDYIVRLTEATRELDQVEVGSSPRGAIALMKAGRAIAAARGRVFVDLDDVKLAAPEVLSHRLVLTAEAEYAKVDPRTLVATVLESVALPDLGRDE
ncbi:UNVERIFIED_CONTAM: hypothetical protein GTU68_053877 [Idotea baltica]|nr:hypothetical protein [Idotea baltica]